MTGGRREVSAIPLPGARERELHPAWLEFIRFCRDLGHGELERLAIQDGLPVLAESVRKKVRFAREP